MGSRAMKGQVAGEKPVRFFPPLHPSQASLPLPEQSLPPRSGSRSWDSWLALSFGIRVPVGAASP